MDYVVVCWQCIGLLVFGFYQFVVDGIGDQVVEVGYCIVMYGDVVVWCIGYYGGIVLWWYVVEYDVEVGLFVVWQGVFLCVENLVVDLVQV